MATLSRRGLGALAAFGLLESLWSRELLAARMGAREGHFMPPALLDSQPMGRGTVQLLKGENGSGLGSR